MKVLNLRIFDILLHLSKKLILFSSWTCIIVIHESKRTVYDLEYGIIRYDSIFLIVTGNLMFIEVEDADIHKDVKLETIPQSFTIHLKKEERAYKLMGIIHFNRPYQQLTHHKQTTTTKNAVGHYTAICPRPGNKWTEFDDIPANGLSKNKTFECCPSALIFGRVLASTEADSII